MAHYNKTEQHRGISGFVQDIGDRINQGLAALDQAYEGLSKGLAQSRNTEEYLDRYSDIQALKTDLAREIYVDYQSLVDRISDENLNADENIGRLADIYNEVDATAKLIDPYRKVAKETCNQQTQNESGNCTGK